MPYLDNSVLARYRLVGHLNVTLRETTDEVARLLVDREVLDDSTILQHVETQVQTLLVGESGAPKRFIIFLLESCCTVRSCHPVPPHSQRSTAQRADEVLLWT